ncbi:hypothetical protein [Streptomyces sp. NPDC004065]|uniref:hypothetical protein n=1 Tax=Streptomyces sp. NPDC004065 TaxID=3364689 RepID=UPI00384EF719
MLLNAVLREALGLLAGTLARTWLGPAGVVLLCALAVGIRARHSGLAVGAAVALTLLMTQA